MIFTIYAICAALTLLGGCLEFKAACSILKADDPKFTNVQNFLLMVIIILAIIPVVNVWFAIQTIRGILKRCGI